MKPLNAPLSRRASQRGATLIEGMAAAAVLALGISGVFGGLIVASRQNADARRLTHASAIATQVRYGMESLGRERVVSPDGPLAAARCTEDEHTLELAGGLEAIEGTCVVDLDAFEDGAGPELHTIPGYAPEDAEDYRRILVWREESMVDAKWGTLTVVDSVAVVVSFGGAGQRRFVRQQIAFHDPSPAVTAAARAAP